MGEFRKMLMKVTGANFAKRIETCRVKKNSNLPGWDEIEWKGMVCDVCVVHMCKECMYGVYLCMCKMYICMCRVYM